MNKNIIAMWSGPRNLSTAMMRSFENRKDTVVFDEPFYAHYLSVTELNHPGRDEILDFQSTNWNEVVEKCTNTSFHEKVTKCTSNPSNRQERSFRSYN